MRSIVFANRVSKEIVRDPLSLFFGLAFPIVLLLLLTAINNSIPVDLFQLSSLTPGVAVFGLSFMALFAAQVISKDRASSFLIRLYTTPLQSKHFIIGYIIPLLVMSVLQSSICVIAAMFLGLSYTASFLLLILTLIPTACIFIGIGIICGTLFSEKAAVALCGAVLTNVSAWFSGVWFDLELIGGLFKEIAYVLPFYHAVELSKAALAGQFDMMSAHVCWVIGYTILILLAAIFVFKRKSKET